MAIEVSTREILPIQGVLTHTAWELPPNLTEHEWQRAGTGLTRVEGSLSWWIGDWWAFGEHRYGDRKALVDSDEWAGPSYQACRDAAWVAEAFELSRRRDNLPFNHHREVASLPQDEADRLLDWAEDQGASIRALREKVKEVKAWLAQGWTHDQLERRGLVEKGFAVVATQRGDADAALLAWAELERKLVRIDRQSEWGNPFEMPADGDRDAVCDNYAQHYLANKPSLLRKVDTLRGKVLACWCHPERCHGDHLAELANGDEDHD